VVSLCRRLPVLQLLHYLPRRSSRWCGRTACPPLSRQIRLAAAIRFWRTSETAEVEGQTDVRNISILSRTDEVINWLDLYIRALKDQHVKDPKLYTKEKDPRTKYLHKELASRLQSDLTQIGALPDIPSSKSVPVIDSALRKLAGYMTAHEIAFSLT